MTEELKSNTKEDLPIRQSLVDTAVGFLLNPNVKQRPDDAKIAFLKNKGLTDSEVAEAFNKAKYEAETAVVSNQDSDLINAYPLPPYRTHIYFLSHLRNYCSAFGSFAVAVYVLHRFYKCYIEPWLFGLKSERSEISALKQQIIELTNSVSRLTSTVASLEEAVNNQIHQIDRTSLYGVESVPKSIQDILDEVHHVKNLLTNRFSFPSPPALAGASIENKTQNGESKKVVTIPKWQLRGSETGKSKVESKEQLDESEDKEKSSIEPSSLKNALSSLEDQTKNEEKNLKIGKDKIQDEDSKTDSENNVEDSEDKDESSKECLENNLSPKGKIQDKEKSSTEPSSLENGLSSLEDQTKNEEKNLKIGKDKIQDEDSKTDSENNVEDSEDKDENSKECLENNLSPKGKIQVKDSKTVVENQVRNIDEKTLDEDSDSESSNK